MRILYIFPHPDDESFGPAPVIGQQIESGHEVFLLTLTKGGATKVYFEIYGEDHKPVLSDVTTGL